MRRWFFRTRPAQELVRSEARWPLDRPIATRVVVEHPDAAVRSAQAAELVAAGYDVQTCSGPGPDDAADACPLLAGEGCRLVEGADVVVTTTELSHGEEIVAALAARERPDVVVQLCQTECPRYRETAADAFLVVQPVLGSQLVDAVDAATAP